MMRDSLESTSEVLGAEMNFDQVVRLVNVLIDRYTDSGFIRADGEALVELREEVIQKCAEHIFTSDRDSEQSRAMVTDETVDDVRDKILEVARENELLAINELKPE